MIDAIGFVGIPPQQTPQKPQIHATETHIQQTAQAQKRTTRIKRNLSHSEQATIQLQEKINKAAAGSTVRVPPGNYGRLAITKSLHLTAANAHKPPNIARIDARNARVVILRHLKIGNARLSPAQIRNLDTIGIRISLTDQPTNITIDHVEVRGVSDGISISHPGVKTANHAKRHAVTIKNSTIHNIRRDGIILRDVGRYAINNNKIHSIHPNYAPYSFKHLQKKDARANHAVLLPNGKKADHADGIQITNGMGGTITQNKLTIGNGTWYQGITVHHEKNSVYNKGGAQVLSIKSNYVENNHDFAIRSSHYGATFADANRAVTRNVNKRQVASNMQVLSYRQRVA